MPWNSRVQGQLDEHGLRATHFRFDRQTRFFQGKVRDLYVIAERWLVMVTTDRISAFDIVLPVTIPYKGQVLNQLSVFFLERASELVPVWLLGSPHPCVSVGVYCTPIPVEMIVRAFLAGSLLRAYQRGQRRWCGVTLPDGLKPYGRLPVTIVTPTTKAEAGHDEDICPEEIVRRRLMTPEEYACVESDSLRLFEWGTNWANQRGLYLVDTKYEFGRFEGRIFLIDEVHTPDSSRYFYQQEYEERMARNQEPRQLSKEYIRQWLIQQGFPIHEPSVRHLPPIPDSVIEETSRRYQEVYTLLTGQAFQPITYDKSLLEHIYESTHTFLREIGAYE